MFDSPEELTNKIALGEDAFLELKEVRISGSKVSAPKRDDLADELAAFANASGGVLVLGVQDGTRRITGIPLASLDSVETFVRDLVTDSIKPPLAPLIVKRVLPDGSGCEVPVITVEVPKSIFVHQSSGGYFHRVGSSKRPIGPDYLARLFQQRSQTRLIRYDETPVYGSELRDLNSTLWNRFRTAQSDQDDETFLTKIGVAAPDEGGILRPTIAGVLLCSEDPTRWLPSAYIQAVSYKGDSVAPENWPHPYQLDAKDITGPLDSQVSQALAFISRNMRMMARKNLGRQDIPQFDLTAMLEALVNAVAHRDYSIYGSKIRLHMFSNRLELYSPGALANTMDVDSMKLRQSARNEVLTSLLARIPLPRTDGLETLRTTLMDRRGEGVPIILSRSKAASGREPEYRLLGDELLLTVYGAE